MKYFLLSFAFFASFLSLNAYAEEYFFCESNPDYPYVIHVYEGDDIRVPELAYKNGLGKYDYYPEIRPLGYLIEVPDNEKATRTAETDLYFVNDDFDETRLECHGFVHNKPVTLEPRLSPKSILWPKNTPRDESLPDPTKPAKLNYIAHIERSDLEPDSVTYACDDEKRIVTETDYSRSNNYKIQIPDPVKFAFKTVFEFKPTNKRWVCGASFVD